MFEVDQAALTLLSTGFQQASKQDQLVVIAIVNAIVWVGVFLFMLWLLNLRFGRVEDRISRLESTISDDNKSAIK